MEPYIFIRNGREYDRVRLADIIYIAGDAEYLAVHICGYDKPLRQKCSFADALRLLTPAFVQIHRSTIINLDHLARLGRTHAVMTDGTTLRITDSHRSLLAALPLSANNPAPPYVDFGVLCFYL